jgi:hypothetical protein
MCNVTHSHIALPILALGRPKPHLKFNVMRKTKFIFICLFMMVSLFTNAKAKDWTKVITAIIQVESKGQKDAVNKNGSCVGLLQITPICVRECNDILKARKSDKHYTLKDRYNEKKSKEMFGLIQEKYNPSNSVETAIRLWNGGVGGLKNKRKTDTYLRKVMKYYNGSN